MLYPTLSQPIVFLYLSLTGLAGGVIYECGTILTKLFDSSKIAKQIFLFISTILCGVLFFLVNLAINYGQFRSYAVFTFIGSIILERITLGKFFAFLGQKCYNAINGRKQKKKTH